MEFPTARLGRFALVGAVATTLCTSTLVAGPARADVSVPRTSAASAEEVHEFNALLDAVDPSARTFDARRASEDGVSSRAIEDFASTWLALGAGPVVGVTVELSDVTSMQDRLISPRACKGRNTWDRTGLQYNVYLSSCKASELSRAYATGSALSVSSLPSSARPASHQVQPEQEWWERSSVLVR